MSIGYIRGWSTFTPGGVHNYKGVVGNFGVGVGPVSIQGSGSRAPGNDGQLSGGSVGAGASLGAKVNGALLEEALKNLPFKFGGGVSYSFNAEDFGLPTTKQVFHAPSKNPTMLDAMNFSQYIDGLASRSQGFSVLAPAGLSLRVKNYFELVLSAG